jgi:hypothetical protein
LHRSKDGQAKDQQMKKEKFVFHLLMLTNLHDGKSND